MTKFCNSLVIAVVSWNAKHGRNVARLRGKLCPEFPYHISYYIFIHHISYIIYHEFIS